PSSRRTICSSSASASSKLIAAISGGAPSGGTPSGGTPSGGTPSGEMPSGGTLGSTIYVLNKKRDRGSVRQQITTARNKTVVAELQQGRAIRHADISTRTCAAALAAS